ncbi:MAG: hypothetical protein Q7Q71_13160 [Verrucomicrobiota bacterium JB023]|nr:hypothetical protein [Verrucomicrobiota bacterium JB023]
MRVLCPVLLTLTLAFSGVMRGELAEGISVPGEERIFKEIGTFEVTGGQLLASKKLSALALAPLLLEVFTDGVDVRVKLSGQDEGYLEFQIYRNDGIFDGGSENLLPGLQGFSDQGGVIRHLSLTQEKLVIVKHPSRSSEIEVTYATRHE